MEKIERMIRTTLKLEKHNKIEQEAKLRECQAKINLLNEIVDEYDKLDDKKKE